MTPVRLRRWRLADLSDLAPLADDPFLRPWSTLDTDPEAWIRREIAEERGPSRAICLDDDDRALGRVAVRLPRFASDAVSCAAIRETDQPAGELSYSLVPEARGRGLARAAVQLMLTTVMAGSGLRSVVLDIEEGNLASMRVADRLGAERRAPVRVKPDRFGVERTLAAYVLMLPPS